MYVAAFTFVTAFASVTASVTAYVTTSVFLACPCQCRVRVIDRARVCVCVLVSVGILVLRDSVRDRVSVRVCGHVRDRDVTVSVPVSLAVQFLCPRSSS